MKKLIIAAAIVCAAAFAQAASTNWMIMSYAPVPGVDGEGTWSGTALLTCVETGWSTDVAVSEGTFTYMGAFDSNPSTSYNFTLTATDPASHATYSASGMGSTDEFGSGFGGINAGAWTVPEPTSGLLLLLGVAGLALKRKRA